MRNTKQLVLGALCSAMVVIVVLVNIMAAGYLIMFIPFPLMFYGARASFHNTITVFVTSVLLVFMVSGLGFALLALAYGFVSLTYTWFKQHNHKKRIVFWGSSFVNIIANALMAFSFSAIIGIDLQADAIFIGELLGLNSGALLTGLVLGVLVVAVLIETWGIIYIYESFETLLGKIAKTEQLR